MNDYSTRRGGLLAQMEHRCEKPGLWFVEGAQVRRIGTRWVVEVGETAETFPSFTDAIVHVAELCDL